MAEVQTTDPEKMAETEENTEKKSTRKKETSKNARETKMVKVKLFKDNGNYKDDVFVGVNGENYQIQRGKEVEVPWYVAEVLEHSERMDNETDQKIAEIVENAAEKESKL